MFLLFPILFIPCSTSKISCACINLLLLHVMNCHQTDKLAEYVGGKETIRNIHECKFAKAEVANYGAKKDVKRNRNSNTLMGQKHTKKTFYGKVFVCQITRPEMYGLHLGSHEELGYETPVTSFTSFIFTKINICDSVSLRDSELCLNHPNYSTWSV